jgi:DNA-binding NarL/FixJ family response regulator
LKVLNTLSIVNKELIMPANKKPRLVIFRENYRQYLDENNVKESDFEDWPVKVKYCENFKELNSYLKSGIDVIAISSTFVKKHSSLSEFMLMMDTLFKFNSVDKRPLVVLGVGKDTHISDIKEMQKSGVDGLFPLLSDYGIDEGKQSITTLLEQKSYWPKHIIQNLSGNTIRPNKTNEIHLTDRQRQVFDLIANRGLSNKQIATVLKISESTVKIHVSAVMKNMCVRNRTQLALTAR